MKAGSSAFVRSHFKMGAGLGCRSRRRWVHVGRGGWAKILPKLPASRERSWDAEGAWGGGAARVWDGWLSSRCLWMIAAQGDGMHAGELTRASGHKKKCASQIHPLQHPLLLQSWRCVAWQVSRASSISQSSISQTSVSSVPSGHPDAPCLLR